MCLECYVVAIEHCADFDFPLLDDQIKHHWLTKNPELLKRLKIASEEARAKLRVHHVKRKRNA